MTAIQFVKAKLDRRQSVTLVMDDARARKVLVGWTLYDPPFKDFSISMEKADPRETLDKLWDAQPPIDFIKLSKICQNMPETRVRSYFESLKAARLVWPDGTISDHIDAIILAEAGLRMQGLIPKEMRQRMRDNQRGGKATS